MRVTNRRTRRAWVWLRRGTALGMALAAVWVIGLTITLPSPLALVKGLGEDADFVVEVMSSQTGWRKYGEMEQKVGPWGRLLLDQSALLSNHTGQSEGVENLPEIQEEILPQDQEKQPEPLPGGNVVEHTSTGEGLEPVQNIYIQNSTGKSVDVAALAAREIKLGLGEGPQILIYHTHGSEAYTQTETSRYQESDSYRTTDCEKNVVRVGEEMANIFRAQGFEVIHDTTLYDYPAYSGAYERSRAGVEHWLEQYPTIRFVLDVHRDALISQDGAAYKLVAQEGDTKAAQVMFVVGSGGSAEHPNWQENLTLAVKLQMALTNRYNQLARPITLRASRFNQHLTKGSLLVEVGGHGNTLEEAVEGGKLFARTVGAALRDMG